MRWPWGTTRASHEAMILLLTSELSSLREERKLLLDKLLTIGGIGPLYSSPQPQDSSPSSPEEEESISAEEMHLATLERLKRTPSKLAAYLTRHATQQARRPLRGPSVALIPDMTKVNAALDQAEALGKKQA